MPNWCTTHYIATGEESDLRSLAETLNTMPNLENGFGRFWMGNILAAFGLSREEMMRKSAGEPSTPTSGLGPASAARVLTRRGGSGSTLTG